MIHQLTAEGYEQTKWKLAQLEARRAAAQLRTDLNEIHHREALHSYDEMIRQYQREIKLYEDMHRIGELAHSEAEAQADRHA